MMLAIIFHKVKHVVLFVINFIRRALCCFRRRRHSHCDDGVPLTYVGIISNKSESQEKWEDWGDTTENSKPQTIQDHIELYRKQTIKQPIVDEPIENQLDFFENMAPRITKQTKVLINSDNSHGHAANRLNFAEDTMTAIEVDDLREWEESYGWEGQTLDTDAQEALRQKKRQEREKRLYEQHQRRQEKVGRSLGAKLTT